MDTRWLEGTAAVLALLAMPVLAFSTAATVSPRVLEAAPAGTFEPAAATAQDVETVEGSVVSVSQGEGEAVLSNGSRSATLRGTPMDLAELRPGSRVSLTFRRYGGVPWLLASGTAGLGGGTGVTGWLDTKRPFMTAVGDVERVDVPRGLVYLDGQVFHGHPAVLRQFERGQRLTVLYQTFGGNRWITPV